MHFLIVFALIGICIIVGPLVLEVGLRIALAFLALIALIIVVAWITEISGWALVAGAPFVLLAGAAFLVPHLEKRQLREILGDYEAERERREIAEHDLKQRAADAVAIWRSVAH